MTDAERREPASGELIMQKGRMVGGNRFEMAVDRSLAESAARVAGWRIEDETPTALALAVHRCAEQLRIEPEAVEVVVRRRLPRVGGGHGG